MKAKYYDGTKLLNKTDLDGYKPEIYICTGNRTAGKSYFFKRFLTTQFIKDNEQKFIVVYRKRDEMHDAINAFFEDIKYDKEITKLKKFDYHSKTEMSGSYQTWFLNDVEMGFAIYLNAAEKIKRNSSRFVNVKWMLFDEMQSETYSYVDDEVEKFISIHMSVARGHGEQSRYVPCILIGNSTSLVNPYFRAMGISDRYNKEAKFIRGSGWVAEFAHNESAENAIKKSAFNRAFAKSKYMAYASENNFLLDNSNFVEKCSLQGAMFIFHFLHEKQHIGAWYLPDGVWYFCSKFDPSDKPIALTKDDHDKETLFRMINIDKLRAAFDRGNVRFESLEISNVIIDALLKI